MVDVGRYWKQGARSWTVSLCVLVWALDGIATGAVRCDACRVGAIECGGCVSGSLSAVDCALARDELFDAWRFELPERRHVTIDLSSTDYDTVIVLMNEACEEVASDDDGGPRLNSRLIIDLDPGVYFVLATQYFVVAGRTGAYTLEISCGEIIDPVEFCAERCKVGEIAPGEMVEADFPLSGCLRRSDTLGQQVDTYRITVEEEGFELTIDLASSDYDSFLELYDSGCDRLTFDDDGGGGIGARIVRVVDAGTYFIGVSSFAPDVGGTYTLTVSGRLAFELCEDCDVGILACDIRATGEFPRTICERDAGPPIEFFTLTTTGGELEIDLVGDYDTYLELYTEGCVFIGFDDDSGDGLNSRLVSTVGPGTYRVGVSSADRDASGSYELVVRCFDPDGVPGRRRFFRGDADEDGVLSLNDALLTFRFLFQGGASPECLETVDVDNDGVVSLTDGITVLQFLFSSGEAPAEPGPPGDGRRCGGDPDPPQSAGDLGCESYAACP